MNISLAQLRANTERIIRDGAPGIETRTDPHTLLALIDTVQAAHTLTGENGEPPICLALGIKNRWQAQQHQLARFDFGSIA